MGGSDPFSVNSDPFSTRAPTTQQRANQITAGEVSAFLSSAGIQNATMMNDAQRKEHLPNMKFAWTTSDHAGGLVYADLAGRSPRGIVNDQIASLSQVCQGTFASYIRPEVKFGEAVLVRFVAACNDVQEPFVTELCTEVGDGVTG